MTPGEGLGRNRQGISTPLMMQKTDKRTGVIVNAEPAPMPGGGAAGEPAEKKQRVGAVIQGQPSKVLCLRNMVSGGGINVDNGGVSFAAHKGNMVVVVGWRCTGLLLDRGLHL